MAGEEGPRGAPGSGTPRHRGFHISTFASLRNRDYRFLWAGNFLASGAQWLQMLTLGWLVLHLTRDPVTGQGSALLSAMVIGIRPLPVLFIGPWAGVLADRIDRRQIVVVVQVALTALGVFFAFLVATERVLVWHAFAYVAISGICHAIIQPVRQALIANTVPRSDLSNALALHALGITSTRLLGPVLGGLLIVTLGGFKWNFFLESAAYAGMALLMIPMRTPYSEGHAAKHSSVFSNMREGFEYVWNDRVILYLIVLSFIPNFVFQPLVLLLPVFTSEVLESGAGLGGTLLAAMGAGGVVATLVIASMGFPIKKGLMALLALVIGSICVIVFAQSHWVPLSILIMVLLGFSHTSFRVSNLTLIQEIVPDTFRGRVTSIYYFDHGFAPLAVLIISLFVEFYGARGTLSIAGGLSLGAALLFLVTAHRIRQLP